MRLRSLLRDQVVDRRTRGASLEQQLLWSCGPSIPAFAGMTKRGGNQLRLVDSLLVKLLSSRDAGFVQQSREIRDDRSLVVADPHWPQTAYRPRRTGPAL